MISITTKKIAGLTPKWARFPGFSLLFDPPDFPFKIDNGLEILHYDSQADRLRSLFALADHGVQRLGLDHLLQTYGFCALPSSSYHVTAFDVANISDLERCHPEVRDSLRASFDALPGENALYSEYLSHATASKLATHNWNLTFGYGGLRQWGSVLAIELLPRDESNYDRFLESRSELSRVYLNTYGVGASESFTPHLSLGYFMNHEGRDLAKSQVQEWDAALKTVIGQATVSFYSTSLYGFTDMATFFRKPPDVKPA